MYSIDSLASKGRSQFWKSVFDALPLLSCRMFLVLELAKQFFEWLDEFVVIIFLLFVLVVFLFVQRRKDFTLGWWSKGLFVGLVGRRRGRRRRGGGRRRRRSRRFATARRNKVGFRPCFIPRRLGISKVLSRGLLLGVEIGPVELVNGQMLNFLSDKDTHKSKSP
jgi:hypothetical protein